MKIDIQKLRNGSHRFEFDTTGEELELVHDKISFGKIHVSSVIDKNDQNILVTNRVSAEVKGQCDNCLADFERELKDSFMLFYTTDPRTADEEGSVRIVSSGARDIDLTEGIRDNLLLDLPMRFLCDENCKGLCPGCGVNLNEDVCTCNKEIMDPRWEALKDIFKKK